MDKPSEQKKDSKSCSDTDLGIHNYHVVDNAGKREQLNGLWEHASEEVVGQPKSRIMTTWYKKPTPECPVPKTDIIDEVLEHGPPVANVSRLKRVF